METVLQDIRYGLRLLRKNAAYTALAAITLALGVGANTAIFSVVYRVIFSPLPYVQSDRLVRVVLRWKQGGMADDLTPILAQAVADDSRIFSSVAVEFPSTGCNLVAGSTPEYVPAKKVSTGFFHTLGTTPALGREFLEQEAAGSAHSAIISYGLWQARLGGDASILGRQIACNGEPATVVGVLPRNFQYAQPADVWLPDRLANHVRDAEGLNFTVIGRLQSGVGLTQARTGARQLWAQLRREHGGEWWIRHTDGFELVPYRKWLAEYVRQPLFLLLGAVALVLLIAAANVAGLMLARTAARSRELAIRSALGARRSRIVRQVLTESVLLSSLGAALGLLLAWYLMAGLRAIFPASVSPSLAGRLPSVDLQNVGLNLPVLLFTAVVSMAAGVLAGIVPALRSLRAEPNVALKQGERSIGDSQAHRRGRNLLLIGEVALSLMLLVGCSLLVRSFLLLRGVNLGFDPQNLQVAQLSLASHQYATTLAVTQFQEKVLQRLRGVPGVAAAASVSSAPLQAGLNLPMPNLPGKDCGNYPVEYRAVSSSYLSAMRIPLLRGRMFTASDNAGSAPVVIINRTMARICWPGADAMGAQVWIGKGEKDGDLPRQVVGVVGDIKEYSLDQATPPMVFVPQSQVPDAIDATLYQAFGLLSAIVIRTNRAVDLSLPLERIVHEVDPNQPVVSVAPMSGLVSDSAALSRVLAGLMASFAGLALLLSMVGLYALLSYDVNQRTQEIGIRMALGAPRERMLAMVVREGIVLVAAGTAIGIAGALAASRLLSSLLFGIAALDGVSFAGATVCLVIVGLLASLVPARRATRVDPMVALRYE